MLAKLFGPFHYLLVPKQLLASKRPRFASLFFKFFHEKLGQIPIISDPEAASESVCTWKLIFSWGSDANKAT